MIISFWLKVLKTLIFIASAFRGQIKKREYIFANIHLRGYYSCPNYSTNFSDSANLVPS